MATLPVSPAALPLLLSLPVLLAACVADMRRRIIPDWTVVVLAGIGLGAAILTKQAGPVLAVGAACAGVGAGLSLLGLWGWGDAKLLAAAGLLVGPDGLLTLANVMVLSGGVIALLLIALRRPVQAGRLPLPAGAPRWLAAEHRRLRRAPSVPYGLAIVAGIVAGMGAP
jgi:prepilin peptidase CpaA